MTTTTSPPSDDEKLIERSKSWDRCYPGNLNVERLVDDLTDRLQALVNENARLREALRQISQFRGQVGLYDIEKNGNLATAVAVAETALAAQEKQG